MANALPSKKKIENCSVSSASSQTQKPMVKFKSFNFDKKQTSSALKYTMPMCHFDSHNLWMLKPTHLNRGRGIHVFNNLESLHKLIKQYCEGHELDSVKKPKKISQQTDTEDQAEENKQGPNSPLKKSVSNKVKFNTFIIQKYIERPLLIHRRKFDIRVWVLLT